MKNLSFLMVVIFIGGAFIWYNNFEIKKEKSLINEQQIAEQRMQGLQNLIGVNQIDSLKKEQAQLMNILNGSSNDVGNQVNEYSKEKFWIKVIFSSIFCISALFVVLSKKYDDETKKWAFSALTLIAGVWIGSVTT